jgi:hypothetical protein
MNCGRGGWPVLSTRQACPVGPVLVRGVSDENEIAGLVARVTNESVLRGLVRVSRYLPQYIGGKQVLGCKGVVLHLVEQRAGTACCATKTKIPAGCPLTWPRVNRRHKDRGERLRARRPHHKNPDPKPPAGCQRYWATTDPSPPFPRETRDRVRDDIAGRDVTKCGSADPRGAPSAKWRCSRRLWRRRACSRGGRWREIG